MSISRAVLGMFAAGFSMALCQNSVGHSATGGESARPKSANVTALRDIKDIEELKTLFNQQTGATRLIVLFSPT